MRGRDTAGSFAASAEAADGASLGRRAAGLGRVLCLAGAALGGLGLLGWFTGSWFLTALVPGEAQMKANTAVALILLGLAGAARRRLDGPRAARILASVAALLVLVIGLGTLIEYGAGRSLGLDELLFKEAPSPYPGRPSPPSALAAALLAGGLLTFDLSPDARARPSEWMIVGAGLLGFAAIVGAAFGAAPLYRLRNAPITGVAVPTAVALLSIAAGMLLERPQGGIARLATSPGPGGTLLRRLALPGFVLPWLLAFALSRAFALFGIQDAALLFATLVAMTTGAGLALLAISAGPLDQAHRALTSSRAAMRELVEQAPDGIFVADLDGRYTDVNRAGCQMLGYSRDELVGKTIVELIAAEEVGRLQATKKRLLEGRAEMSEWLLRRKDGAYVAVELNALILADGRWQAFVRDITARKRIEAERQKAEEALRMSELKFRRLVEAMPDGVFIFQSDRIVYANPSLATLLGYPNAAALLGLSMPELVTPQSLDLARARLRLVKTSGQTAPPQEVTLLRKDGAAAVVETVGVRVDFEGAPAAVVVTRDLSERLRTEQALRASEARFSGIISGSADAIMSVDGAGNITIFNAGAEEIFGYSRAEVLGRPLDLLIPERFRDIHRRHVAAFATEKVAARKMGERLASIKGRRKNGEEFSADASISNLKVGDEKLLTVVLRDVTERERLENEQRNLAEMGVVLARTLDYQETLAAVARIAVKAFADWCVVEMIEPAEGLRCRKIVSADPARAGAAEQLETVKLDGERSYLGKPVTELREPWLAPRVTAAEIEAAAQDQDHRRALRELDPASILAVPLIYREQHLGVLTFVSCQPTRRFGAADLRWAGAIAERAALAIENALLYRDALQATGMRDQVLGVVAHDLRNPLGAIALHAAALQRRGHEPDRRNQRHKQAIERAAQRMNRLIQDLLDVAVTESGKLRVEKAALAPDALLDEAVEMQRVLAAAASVDLRVEAAPDMPPILGDRERLLQVFGNLIGNALKFTEKGGRVTVGVAPGESAALFWVADTGRGMTSDEVSRAFERFWQASSRSGRLGAGLGLPITKGIVEAHGGRIWVESAPGRGSTFFFSIPLAAAESLGAGDVMH